MAYTIVAIHYIIAFLPACTCYRQFPYSKHVALEMTSELFFGALVPRVTSVGQFLGTGSPYPRPAGQQNFSCPEYLQNEIMMITHGIRMLKMDTQAFAPWYIQMC